MTNTTDHSMTMQSALHLLNNVEQLGRHPSIIAAARAAMFVFTPEEQKLRMKSSNGTVNRLKYKLMSSCRIVVEHRVTVLPYGSVLTPRQEIPEAETEAADDNQTKPPNTPAAVAVVTGKSRVYAQSTSSGKWRT